MPAPTSNASYPATSVLLVGESKTGKSYSINSLKCSRVVFLLDAKGSESYRFPYHELDPGTLGLDGAAILATLSPDTNIVIDYTKAFTGIASTVTTGQDGFEQMWRKFVSDHNALANLPPVVTVLDGLTGTSRLILTTVCALNKRPKPFQEDWGQAIAKIVEIIQSFVSQHHTFVMMAHIQMEKDELSGKVKELPLIYGKRLPDEIPACFSSVFRTGYKANKYVWLTKPQPLFAPVGSRLYDNLPEVMEPNFDDFLLGHAKAVSLRT